MPADRGAARAARTQYDSGVDTDSDGSATAMSLGSPMYKLSYHNERLDEGITDGPVSALVHALLREPSGVKQMLEPPRQEMDTWMVAGGSGCGSNSNSGPDVEPEVLVSLPTCTEMAGPAANTVCSGPPPELARGEVVTIKEQVPFQLATMAHQPVIDDAAAAAAAAAAGQPRCFRVSYPSHGMGAMTATTTTTTTMAATTTTTATTTISSSCYYQDQSFALSSFDQSGGGAAAGGKASKSVSQARLNRLRAKQIYPKKPPRKSDDNELRLAAAAKDVARCEELLKGGARAETADSRGRTALHFAVTVRGGASLVNLLLRHGADPNAQDIAGNTPLHLAIWINDGPVIEQLLQHGSDLTAVDRSGKTPIQLATSALRSILHQSTSDSSNGREVADRIRKETLKTIACLQGYLEKRGDRTALGDSGSLLSSFQKRILVSKTSEQFNSDVSDLLSSLQHLQLL